MARTRPERDDGAGGRHRTSQQIDCFVSNPGAGEDPLLTGGVAEQTQRVRTAKAARVLLSCAPVKVAGAGPSRASGSATARSQRRSFELSSSAQAPGSSIRLNESALPLEAAEEGAPRAELFQPGGYPAGGARALAGYDIALRDFGLMLAASRGWPPSMTRLGIGSAPGGSLRSTAAVACSPRKRVV